MRRDVSKERVAEAFYRENERSFIIYAFGVTRVNVKENRIQQVKQLDTVL